MFKKFKINKVLKTIIIANFLLINNIQAMEKNNKGNEQKNSENGQSNSNYGINNLVENFDSILKSNLYETQVVMTSSLQNSQSNLSRQMLQVQEENIQVLDGKFLEIQNQLQNMQQLNLEKIKKEAEENASKKYEDEIIRLKREIEQKDQTIKQLEQTHKESENLIEEVFNQNLKNVQEQSSIIQLQQLEKNYQELIEEMKRINILNDALKEKNKSLISQSEQQSELLKQNNQQIDALNRKIENLQNELKTYEFLNKEHHIE